MLNKLKNTEMPKKTVKPLIAPPDIRKREGEPTYKSHQDTNESLLWSSLLFVFNRKQEIH